MADLYKTLLGLVPPLAINVCLFSRLVLAKLITVDEFKYILKDLENSLDFLFLKPIHAS